MTQLRERMLDDMRLRGLAPKTQEAYVGAVRQLAAHYSKPPDKVTENQLREYFLYLLKERQVSASAFTIALCVGSSSSTNARCTRAGRHSSGCVRLVRRSFRWYSVSTKWGVSSTVCTAHGIASA